MAYKRATEPKKAGDKQMIYLNNSKDVLDFVNSQSNISDAIRVAIRLFVEQVGCIDTTKYIPAIYQMEGSITDYIKNLQMSGTITLPADSLLKNIANSTGAIQESNTNMQELMENLLTLTKQAQITNQEVHPMENTIHSSDQLEPKQEKVEKEGVKGLNVEPNDNPVMFRAVDIVNTESKEEVRRHKKSVEEKEESLVKVEIHEEVVDDFPEKPDVEIPVPSFMKNRL